jgi:AraC-like DNA-binding protein
VQFAHRPPELAADYRRVFRTSVRFNAESTGIVFASSWMQRPIDGADPGLRDFIAAALNDATANGSMSFGEKVRCVLPQLVLSGSASAAAVAQLFGVPERTLRRRLAEESTSLQKLINEARFELAGQLLSDTGLSVAQIAAALHYADPNVFSRAFRSWANVSPSQWRCKTAEAAARLPAPSNTGRDRRHTRGAPAAPGESVV